MPVEILYQSFVLELYSRESNEWEAIGEWADTRKEANEKRKTLEARPGLSGKYRVAEIVTVRKAGR